MTDDARTSQGPQNNTTLQILDDGSRAEECIPEKRYRLIRTEEILWN